MIPLAIHPIMDFTGTSLDLARLSDVAFGVTADAMMLPVAQALVVEMGGEPVVIAEEDRGLYAAALALALDPLGSVAATAWEGLAAVGVEDPSRLFGPLLRAGVDNALMAGPAAGLRAARLREPGAVASAARAWASPEAPEQAAPVYNAMVRAATARALARGEIDASRAAAVLDALGGAGPA